jgi:threonine/homoserine/homoserine lactone efflux protein
LFYLAWQVWHAPVELNTTALAVTGSKGANFVLSYAEGMLISATNPKVMLFYIAFLPTFIDLTLLTSQGALMMGLMLIAYSAGKARKLFSQHKSVQRLNRITAGLMGTAGLLILTR